MKARPYTYTVLCLTVIATTLAALHFRSHAATTGSAVVSTLYALNGCITLFAAPLFILGLGHFTPEFRRTYRIFCTGVALLGVSQLFLFASSLLHLSRDEISILTSIPYILSFLLEFLGLRACAKVLGIKTGWSSFTRLIIVAIIVAPLAAFLPHADAGTTAKATDITVGSLAFMGAFSVFMACLAGHIRKATGALYSEAMRWLWISLIAYASANIFILIEEWLLGGEANQAVFAIGIATDSIASFLLLRAGYVHNFMDVQTTKDVSSTEQVSSVDIIVYTAGLISNASEVDAILDTIRGITARLAPGEPISAEDQYRLRDTYLQLETYLTTEEPAQRFTVVDLRKLVSSTLHLENATQTFWPQLPPLSTVMPPA